MFWFEKQVKVPHEIRATLDAKTIYFKNLAIVQYFKEFKIKT